MRDGGSVAEQPVRYEVVDSVACLTINRPEARNALNNAVRTGLFDAVRRFNDDDLVANRLLAHWVLRPSTSPRI